MHFNDGSPVRFLSRRVGYDFRGGRFACGCDGNLDVSTLFELHFIAMLVRQRILNTARPSPAPGQCRSFSPYCEAD
jgi:hypothetical protein